VNTVRTKPQTTYEKHNDFMDDFPQFKLLSLFLTAGLSSFLTCDTDRQRQAVVTLTLYNSGWDRLGVTYFLTLCHLCLGLDPYLGELLG